MKANHGAFLYANGVADSYANSLTISNSRFYGLANPISEQTDSLFKIGFITNIASTNNYFTNCHSEGEGAIFKVMDASEFRDSNSTYY